MSGFRPVCSILNRFCHQHHRLKESDNEPGENIMSLHIPWHGWLSKLEQLEKNRPGDLVLEQDEVTKQVLVHPRRVKYRVVLVGLDRPCILPEELNQEAAINDQHFYELFVIQISHRLCIASASRALQRSDLIDEELQGLFWRELKAMEELLQSFCFKEEANFLLSIGMSTDTCSLWVVSSILYNFTKPIKRNYLFVGGFSDLVSYFVKFEILDFHWIKDILLIYKMTIGGLKTC